MADFDDYEDPINELDAPESDEDNGSDTSIVANEDESMINHSFDDDGLTVSEDDLNSLEDKASQIERSDSDKSQISFGRKMCPTRHGCQGATDCDYSYGGYPG